MITKILIIHLDVDVPGCVLPDDVGIGVYDPQHMSDLLLSELKLANVDDEVDHPAEHLVLSVRALSVVHQDVKHLPGSWVILLEPEHPEGHDGVVPPVWLVEVGDGELWAGVPDHGALPGVGPLLLLAVRPAQRPAAVATSVHQTCVTIVTNIVTFDVTPGNLW